MEIYGDHGGHGRISGEMGLLWAPLRHGETNFEVFFWGTCPIKEPIVVI